MRKVESSLVWSVLAAAAITATVQAETAAPSALQQQVTSGSSESSASQSIDDTIEKCKHPFEGFSWGADQRLRQEYFNNAITLNSQATGHEYNFSRNRTRLWASYSPVDFIELNARLSWEWRYWFEPESRQGPDWAQVTVDQLNAKIKMPQINSYVTVGRQDIMFGDGWLVLDGTPLDGSTTTYFDALRFNMDIKDVNTKVDAIYINNYSSPDMWLPTMNDTDRAMIEQNERGAILYVSNKSIKDTTIDGYFIYKHDEKVLVNGDDADIYTLGTRGEHLFSENLKGRAEGAYQFGDKNSRELSAFGATGRMTYMFKDAYDQQVFLGGEYLSGRSGPNGRDGQFDPLWGRWPQFSELYVYSYVTETRIAETTNLIRFGPGYEIHPTPKMTLTATYNALFAATNPLEGSTSFGEGNFRGHLFTSVLKYKFNKHVSGHLLSEYFVPGNYYASNRDDGAVYLRAELMFTF